MFPIIDTHAHLWLKQDAVVEGKRILTLEDGKSEFMGELRQMVPPFITDGKNTAEILISNMNYAQVASAVITQDYIDGDQNEYLIDVHKRYHNLLKFFGLIDALHPDYFCQAKHL